MRWRVGLLVSVLLLRLAVGGVLSQRCVDGQQIRLAGKVNKLYQVGTKQNILVGNFLVELQGNNYLAVNQMVVVTGSCKRRVIDFFESQNRLIEGRLMSVGEKVLPSVSLGGYFISFRMKLVESVRKVVPWPESEVIAGIVLGFKGEMGEYYDKFVRAGLIHILVASGYNVTIVAVVVLDSLIGYVSRKKAVVIALLAVGGYVMLSGGEPPIVRAALMGGILMLGKAYGKQVDIVWLLWLVSGLMIAIEPAMLTNVSFQLSVASMAGLVYLQPRLDSLVSRLSQGMNWGEMVKRTELLTTIAAQTATAPIIWWHFGRVSWWGIMTNLIVLPLVPYIMAVGSVAMVAALAWMPLGVMPGIVAYGLTKVLILVASLF